ncbi:MAG: AmmeMemoRadiSam system protein B, partial [Planctomycetes bacterium]|nr:AmmeMemoRadiSam system protein B [Planctomycetota bacterium]
MSSHDLNPLAGNSMKKYIAISIVAISIVVAIAVAALSNGQEVLKATGAGRWYPADPEELAAQVDSFLKEKPDSAPDGKPVALISPHAGFVYSGKCAGAAFAAVKGLRYGRVIVLGISHGGPFTGASIRQAAAYMTPLGSIPLDQEACSELLEHKLFSTVPAAHTLEHSVENELPFLQRAIRGKFKLVPILIGSVTPAQTKDIARRISALLDGNTLLVASSDFTHHGRDYVRFSTDLKANLEKLATAAAKPILALDFDGFRKHITRTGDTICGCNAIGVLLCALPRGSKGAIARYYTSGDITGDYANSVGYLSFIFTKGAAMLNAQGQATLLDVARKTIEAAIEGKKLPVIVVDAPELQGHQGAFVTITKAGKLRGCIGRFTADEPLYKVVQQVARSSALEDPRFVNQRLTADELAAINIEISVLSPMERVKNPLEEVKLGVHGIYIQRGARSGTYLPQVATDHNMTLEEFLSSCCANKAGLSPD